MVDTASYRVTSLIASLVPIPDFSTAEGSIQGTSEISSQGASWRVFIRAFVTSAFATGSVIDSLITAFITRAFTVGASRLTNDSGS
jgi:hypothetical protein